MAILNKRQLNLVSFFILIMMILSNNCFSQNGLKAEYYDGANFDRYVTSEYVANIDQSWYDQPPVPGIDPHDCSIRWTGKLKTAKSGTYSFSAQVDDGIRVWIDNKLIIDQWGLNDLGQFKGTTKLTANQEYDLKVEYFNAMVEGEIRLLWKMHKEELSWYERLFGDGIEFAVIPAKNFLPPSEPIKVAMKEEVVKQKKKVEKTPPKKKPTTTPVKNTKPVIQPVQKPTAPPVRNTTSVTKPIQKPTAPSIKEVIKAETPKPIVDARAAEKFIPKNVQFEKGKTKILEESFKELDAFVQFMLKYPHLKVMVEGHTDVIGDAQLNLVLSKNRAKTITDYLVKNGINSRRITYEGYGGSRPLVVPEEGKYHPANRRVVFIVDGLED